MGAGRSIMIVAGDPSGDRHAAAFLRQLRRQSPQTVTFGIGGPSMQREGFEALMPFEPFNKMGLAEVLIHLPFFLSAKKKLVRELESRKPSVLVCVDYPGMNMLLMKEANRRNIPVLWYIVPQVWAWKKKRAVELGKLSTLIATVFPFEVEFFENYGARVEFVGHPLVEHLREKGISVRDRHAAERRISDGDIRLAILPGSRAQEVRHMLGPMLEACELLKKRHPRLKITVSRTPHLSESLFAGVEKNEQVTLFSGPLEELLVGTDIALVTSGTATLETALHQVPLVVAYKTSPLTFAILRSLVRMDYIGLPNIVAGEKIVPECIQNRVNPRDLFQEAEGLIVSTNRYIETVERLGSLRGRLGDLEPSTRVAQLAVDIAEGKLSRTA